MSCELHSAYAPNNKPSKLYADLLAVTKDADMALYLWAMSRTKEYKTIMGDWTRGEGNVDENGEPLAEDVLGKDSFVSTSELDTKLKTKVSEQVQEYSEKIKNISKLRLKVMDVLTKRISELSKSTSGKSSEIHKNLSELKTKVETMDWREMTNSFVLEAAKTVEFVEREMVDQIESGSPDMNKLRRLNGYIQAFSVIQDIVNEINASKLLSDSMKDSMPMIYNVIATMGGIQNKYKGFLDNMIATKLSSMSTFVDKDAVKELLKFGNGDVHYMERLGYFMGDSKDPILALIAKTVNEAQQKTRHESIEFNHKLAEVVGRLEKEREQYKATPEKLYAPILEKDKAGNLTGNYITAKKNYKEYVAFKEKYKGTALEEFYDLFTERYEELNSYLPGHYNMENRLPTVRKGKLDRFTSSTDKFTEAKEFLKNKIVASNLDTHKGQLTDDSQRAIDEVPIKYTQKFDSSTYRAEKAKQIKAGATEETASALAIRFAQKELASQISYDLAESLQKFNEMATNYNNMMEIIDVVEGSKEALRTRQVAITDTKGNAILSRRKDMNDRRITKEGSETNAYAMADSYISAQVYGQTEDTAGTIAAFGTEIDVNKLLGIIQSNTSTLMLGLNVVAGTANILTGETMQWEEAMGGEFWDTKSYASANKEYISSMVDILEDLGNRLPKSKINLVNEYYDVLGDYFPGGVGAGESSSLRRALKKGSVHIISSMGEHSMQTKGMIAMMRATKTYTKTGEESGNLWSAHEAVDGKLTVKPDTYTKDSSGELVLFDQLEKDKLSRKIQFVLRRLHGNYNSETAAAWQKNAYLQLIGQFRKWLLDGLARRYGKTQNNEFIESQVEGTYISFAKVFNALRKDLMSESVMYGTNWSTMTAHQKANAKKTVFEIGMVVSLAVGMALLKSLVGGLDEDKDKGKLHAVRSLIYLNNRLSSELLFFTGISSWQILKSPAASMGTIESIGAVISQSLPWNITEKYVAGANRGDYKIFNKLMKATPLIKQYERITPNGMRNQIQYFNLN